ncbi:MULTISPECIES: AsnC family protein [Amycolatopsis]|uniref:AsnC family protein n=1 Tax=Amycolatopsis dendrobii TaxID=2760662 RepID=A0A7W3W136_9PSEU|nr:MULTISPECIES: AsnC family protein [Amycolatopsis]MBB1156397.1 AsnC family protein [Amycolatopsis dendrobii]UKD59715.1 AsnC family protein [Amycolatopsis sp. FU40]
MTDPADIRLLAALAELGKGAVHELAAKVGMDPREVAYRLVALSGSGLPLLVGVESDPNGLRAAISGAPASWQRPQGPGGGYPGGPGSAPFPAAGQNPGSMPGPNPGGIPGPMASGPGATPGAMPSGPGPMNSPASAGVPVRGGTSGAQGSGMPGASGPHPPGPNGVPGPDSPGMPGHSGPHPPGQHGMPGPGTSGAYSPGQTGLPGPGTSGAYPPAQTGIPGPSGGYAPGVSGAYAPGPAGIPGVSGAYPPGPNGIPAGPGVSGAYSPGQLPPAGPSVHNGPYPAPDPVVSTWGVPQTASWARGDEPRPAAAPAKQGRIGETMQSQGLEGEQLSVQLLEVQDPADFLFGAAGYRLEDGERAVVVHTEITNRGPIPFASLPDNYLELVTDSGETIAKAPVSLTSRPPHKIGVQPGETLGGHTVYVLPTATRVVSVRWSPRPEPDERTLTWAVG